MAYDAWGGSWGGSWALSWTGEHTPTPPAPTPAPQGGGGGRKRLHTRRARYSDESRAIELSLQGIAPEAQDVIIAVAERQAYDSRGDDQKRYEELQRELELDGIEWQSQYLELMNSVRQQFIDFEIKRRMREIANQQEEEAILIMLAGLL